MWRMFVDNWPLKLLALALAVLVWLYANSVVIRTTTIEAALDVTHPPTVEVTVNPENRRVALLVSGPTSVIEELSRRNIRIVCGIAGVENLQADRVDKVLLDEKMVTDLPGQIQVTRFRPSTFELTVRPLATMTFPVNPPVTVGRPAPGYQVGRTEIRGLSSVIVTGPGSVLGRMQEELRGVDTEPVDVTNRSESIKDRKLRIQTVVRLDNATVERIRCDDAVEAFVEIRRVNATAVIQAVPISVLTAPDSPREVEITSRNPIDLAVEGPAESLQNLTADQVQAFVDVRKRKPENDLPFFEKLIVHGLPEGVKLEKEVVVTARFRLPPKK
jgi:YbbR domain-containing protein